jgi:hypothetical protein
LIQFSSVATDEGGNSLSGVVSITFSLYAGQQSGEPLWSETQNNVQLDPTGHYSVQLGITRPNGVPTTLFTTGEARWLGVRIGEQAEQPRVLLVSAPYALKAGDAATIGGLPPSAFVLAAPQNGTAPAYVAESVTGQSAQPAAGTAVTGTGTVNYLPLWDTTSDIISSVLYQAGTGATAKIGINTATPASTLDIKGGSTVRGTLSLPATGAATATAGKNSQPLTQVASAFSSGTGKAVNQTFRWQAEPASNDTANPSATLNLLFGSGTTAPTETGLNIASDGVITFAAGQTFPTVTGNETVTGNISSGGSVNAATSFDIAGTPFAFGSNANGNALLGFAGNSTMTGYYDMASGWQALLSNTTGYRNTASGGQALYSNTKGYQNTAGGAYALYTNTTGYQNTANGDSALYSNATGNFNTASGFQALAYSTGNSNTATGWQALYSNTTGTNNTALGYAANVGSGNLSNATAIGANATVTESNALVLGGTGSNAVNVGIGTTAPSAALQVVAVQEVPGGSFTGWTAPSGSELNGSAGVVGTGGNGDPSFPRNGGAGVIGYGGKGGVIVTGTWGNDGAGGSFTGGNNLFDGDGVDAYAGSGYAGNFTGNLNVSGTLSATTKDFKIDHPLDPANKYLVHASVESSEMMNIYTGNVTTDGQGQATVQLPEWFEVLNTDFRYQLTVIGQFAQAIVARKIENNQFEIRTSVPNVEVSWQVTGVRQDAYAKAHPLVVEQEKEARLRGFYIHPEFYGAPPEKQIEWARHPQMMKKMQEMRAKQQATIRAAAQPVVAQPK